MVFFVELVQRLSNVHFPFLWFGKLFYLFTVLFTRDMAFNNWFRDFFFTSLSSEENGIANHFKRPVKLNSSSRFLAETCVRIVIRGSEWGYLDNTKHFIFWLCNMKQLNFRHFNTNIKKFYKTVFFFHKEAKTAPKRPILFFNIIKKFWAILRWFRIIPEDFWRLPYISENCRTFSKTNEEVQPLPKMS